MNLRYFFSSLVLTAVVCLAVNFFGSRTEAFFYSIESKKIGSFSSANLAALSQKRPAQAPEISAKAAIAVLVDKNGERRPVFEKKSDTALPIASISKLMTAKVVLENYSLESRITASSEAVGENPEGFPKAGQTLTVENLLHSLLIESSNEAAGVLEEPVGHEAFLELMNLEAKKMRLASTSFFNSSGLDPTESGGRYNYSTAREVAELALEIVKNPVASEIMTKTRYDVPSENSFSHRATTTNKLLLSSSEIGRGKIIAGKTGETFLARGCLVLVLENEKTGGKLATVVLGSSDRFKETREIIDWVNGNFNW